MAKTNNGASPPRATSSVIPLVGSVTFPDLAMGRDHLVQLAHEIRGPLMALATSAELLSEEVDWRDRNQIRRMAEAIRARTLWLQGLAENVLCAAAVQTGRFRIQPQHVSLVQIVQETLDLLAPVLGQREQPSRVRVRRVLPGRAPGTETDVLADPRRIGQVLVNLVLNASKYAPRGTPIEFFLSTHNGSLRVTVADRGPGLPPGRPAWLFKPFYRGAHHQPPGLQNTAPARDDQPAPGGVGLGLAIVRTIVLAHGGRLGARNRVGGGALFWFDLPPAGPSGSAGPRRRYGSSGPKSSHDGATR